MDIIGNSPVREVDSNPRKVSENHYNFPLKPIKKYPQPLAFRTRAKTGSLPHFVAMWKLFSSPSQHFLSGLKFEEAAGAAAAGDREATGGDIKEREEGTKMGASERERREERGEVMGRVIQTVQKLTDRDCESEQKVS